MRTTLVNILLIEDNIDHAELVKRSFEDHPVANSICHISDGEAALDYLLQRSDKQHCKDCPWPNVILLDLRLPKVDGLEVLKAIRSSEGLNDVPVVVLTSSHAEADVQTAYEHHANSYLIKPLDFESFTKMMNDLGSYWLGWNHSPV